MVFHLFVVIVRFFHPVRHLSSHTTTWWHRQRWSKHPHNPQRVLRRQWCSTLRGRSRTHRAYRRCRNPALSLATDGKFIAKSLVQLVKKHVAWWPSTFGGKGQEGTIVFNVLLVLCPIDVSSDRDAFLLIVYAIAFCQWYRLTSCLFTSISWSVLQRSAKALRGLDVSLYSVSQMLSII